VKKNRKSYTEARLCVISKTTKVGLKPKSIHINNEVFYIFSYCLKKIILIFVLVIVLKMILVFVGCLMLLL